jgi:hypothetical protein
VDVVALHIEQLDFFGRLAWEDSRLASGLVIALFSYCSFPYRMVTVYALTARDYKFATQYRLPVQ